MAKITKRQLLAQKEKCENAARILMCCLEKLSQMASEVYGEDLSADICNGNEIEFRTFVQDVSDSDVIITFEDIFEKCN